MRVKAGVLDEVKGERKGRISVSAIKLDTISWGLQRANQTLMNALAFPKS
jgi:hypothetical protein